MTPFYQDDYATIYHGDCREILPQLPKVDLVLTDPPYGIDYEAGDSSQVGIQNFERVYGDNEQFDASFLLAYPDLICWGANNYTHSLPQRDGQFYAWDKVCQNSLKVRIAECEYAYHKQGTKPRIFRHLWSGAYRASEAGQKSQHPTQKPVLLLDWCIKLSPTTGTILDPFMGSGTTLVAAKQLGRKSIGVEIEERYCEIAAKRLRNTVTDMFLAVEKPPKPTTPSMFT